MKETIENKPKVNMEVLIDHHWIAEDKKSQMLPNTLTIKLFLVKSIRNKKEEIKKGKISKFHFQEKALSASRK
jgi:hypothetical protein